MAYGDKEALKRLAWALYAFLLVVALVITLLLDVLDAGAQGGGQSTPQPACPPEESLGEGTPWPGPDDLSYDYLQTCAHCLHSTPTATSLLATFQPTATEAVAQWHTDCADTYPVNFQSPPHWPIFVDLSNKGLHEAVYGVLFHVEAEHPDTSGVRQIAYDCYEMPEHVVPMWLCSAPEHDTLLEFGQDYCYTVRGYESLCDQLAPGAVQRVLDNETEPWLPYSETGKPLGLPFDLESSEQGIFWIADVRLILHDSQVPACGLTPSTATPTPTATLELTPSATPTPEPEGCGGYDWCHFFDFRQEDHGFSGGTWIAGEGLRGFQPGVSSGHTGVDPKRHPEYLGGTLAFIACEWWGQTTFSADQFSMGFSNRPAFMSTPCENGPGAHRCEATGSADVYSSIREFYCHLHGYNGADYREVEDAPVIRALEIRGYGQDPFGEPHSWPTATAVASPTPTATFTPEVTAVWNTPTPGATYDPGACSTFDWRDDLPAGSVDVDWEDLVVEGDCYTLVPEGEIDVPGLPLGIGGGTHLEWDGFAVCVNWVRFPAVEVLGIAVSLDWFLLPALAWLVNRILTL